MAGISFYRPTYALGLTLFGAAFAMGLVQAWRSHSTLPDLSGNYLAQAGAAFETGNVERAISQVRTYAHLEPRRADSWVRLGLALTAVGDRAGAIAAFERSLDFPTLTGTPALTHQRLAKLYSEVGRLEDAERHTRAAQSSGGPAPSVLEGLTGYGTQP